MFLPVRTHTPTHTAAANDLARPTIQGYKKFQRFVGFVIICNPILKLLGVSL